MTTSDPMPHFRGRLGHADLPRFPRLPTPPSSSRAPRRPAAAWRTRIATLLLSLLIGLAGPGITHAALDAHGEARFKQLSEELRCLVCQNQTLADSHADLAVDLRNQVQAMIEQGRSDDDIKSYLVDRYGQFVLYKPLVQRSTWLLWGGPFALLLLGLLVWWRIGRRAPPSPPAAGAGRGPEAPSPEADATLDAARRLLDDR